MFSAEVSRSISRVPLGRRAVTGAAVAVAAVVACSLIATARGDDVLVSVRDTAAVPVPLGAGSSPPPRRAAAGAYLLAEIFGCSSVMGAIKRGR